MKQEDLMATRRPHETPSRIRSPRFLWVSLLTVVMTLQVTAVAMAAPGGQILIAGYGPELPIIQDLARAYEKGHPGTAIDIEWDKALRAVEKLKQRSTDCCDRSTGRRVTSHPDRMGWHRGDRKLCQPGSGGYDASGKGALLRTDFPLVGSRRRQSEG